MNRTDAGAVEKPEKEHFFAPTQWTVVLEAKDDSTQALNSLCATYRAPLIALLCCRGEKTENAEDLVQGFLVHLFNNDGLKNVAREKGRFRTFLLTAFQNYIRDQHKWASAAKRGGGQSVASLDETRTEGRPFEPAALDAGPDLAYDRAWAKAVLANALNRLETECQRTGHGALCEVLEPVLFRDDDAPAYSQVACELKMSEGAVKMAAHRIRQRLAALIRDEVKQTVATQADLQAELKYLQVLFGRSTP